MLLKTDDRTRIRLDFEEWLPDFEPRSAVMRATRYSPMAFAKRWRAVVDQITLPHEFHPVLATNAVGYR